MKRKLIAFILAAAMLAAMFSAACSKPEGGDRQGNATAAPETTDEPSPGGEATPTPAPETVPPETDAPETTDPTAEPVPVTVPTLLHPVIRSKYEGTEKNDEYIGFTNAGVTLAGDEADAYPALAAALEERFTANDRVNSNEFSEFVMGFDGDTTHNDDEDYFGHALHVRAYVRRADSAAFSVLYSHDYTRGTYTDYYRSADNFDSATGRRLAVADVVTDPSELPRMINEQLELSNDSGFPLEKSSGYYEPYFNDPNCGDFAWTLDYNGITFFFNKGAFGVENAYCYSVFVPFAAYPELFKAEYTTAPESYAVAFPANQNCAFGINGKNTEVLVKASGYMEWTYTMLFVSLDEEYYFDDAEMFDVDPILVHANGRDYLYIQMSGMDDSSMIYVLDISNGHAKDCGKYPYSWYGWEDYVRDGDYTAAMEPITDPAAFRLSRRTDLLSTVDGYKVFCVDANGAPVSEDGLYSFDRIFTFTMLTDLDAVLVDENGAELGSVTLHEGTHVDYVATDAEAVGILRIEGGRLAKVTVEHVDYQYCIGGTPIGEIFDGLMYAG